jgi:hypothetical protein
MFAQLASRTRRVAAIAFAVAGFAAVSTAAPASAYMTANLSIGSTMQSDICSVGLYGDFPMSKSEAQAKINAGYGVVVRIWGDDQYYDDLLAGPYRLGPYGHTISYGQVWATDNGLQYVIRMDMTASRLNEDSVPGNPYDEMDDIYAGVRMVNKGGSTIAKVESNRVYGFFGDDFRIENRSRTPCGA